MPNFTRNDLPDNKGVIFEHWDVELDFFYEDKILVLGDSHSEVFKYIDTHHKDYFFPYVCTIAGATAQGAVNINSKTNALQEFNELIDNYGRTTNRLLIMLGEVDCGFLIWARAKRLGISVDEQIDLSITNLFQFIHNVLENPNNNYQKSDIIVAGSILPVIEDNTALEHLNGGRAEADISQEIRTEKTLEYNKLLKERCVEKGYNYIDITDYTMGEDGLIDTYYTRKENEFYGDLDHHLDCNKTNTLWQREIEKIIRF